MSLRADRGPCTVRFSPYDRTVRCRRAALRCKSLGIDGKQNPKKPKINASKNMLMTDMSNAPVALVSHYAYRSSHPIRTACALRPCVMRCGPFRLSPARFVAPAASSDDAPSLDSPLDQRLYPLRTFLPVHGARVHLTHAHRATFGTVCFTSQVHSG